MAGKIRPHRSLEGFRRFGSSIHFGGVPLQRLARYLTQPHPAVLLEHRRNDVVVDPIAPCVAMAVLNPVSPNPHLARATTSIHFIHRGFV